jgi:hypothetical protein
MPQATIKLQQAPAPATAVRKPAAAVASDAAKAENDGKPVDGKPVEVKPSAPASKVAEATLSEGVDEVDAGDDSSGIPLPFLIAAAVLALAALGIQIWTYIS